MKPIDKMIKSIREGDLPAGVLSEELEGKTPLDEKGWRWKGKFSEREGPLGIVVTLLARGVSFTTPSIDKNLWVERKWKEHWRDVLRDAANYYFQHGETPRGSQITTN